MHKYIILFFLVLTLLCSCNRDNTPEGILNKQAMTNVLIDVHTVDGSLANLTQQPDSLFKYGTSRYQAVFKKYHTDSAGFKRSFKYYALKPDKFVNIYIDVLKRLQTKTDSITKLLAIQNKTKHPVPATTGGRVAPGQAGPITPPAPVRPGIIVNPSQQTMIRFNAKRDSMLRQQQERLKERNALPKK
jgi:hypothetical protein